MNDYTTSLVLGLDKKQILDTITTAGYEIGYWAVSHRANPDREIYIVHTGEAPFDDDQIRFETTFRRIFDAIVSIANGETAVRRDIREQCQSFLTANTDHLDGEASDVALQVALFGKIVFG